MNKIILFFSLLAGVAIVAQPRVTGAPTADDKNPVIKFETTEHNFGNVPQGPPSATYVFKFKNTGKAPLILSEVLTSCGCTTPEWSKEPVLPGKSGEIKVGYNALSLGGFSKTITVRSNAGADVVLTILGNVVAKPSVTPEKNEQPHN
jgi:hypothetical protein